MAHVRQLSDMIKTTEVSNSEDSSAGDSGDGKILVAESSRRGQYRRIVLIVLASTFVFALIVMIAAAIVTARKSRSGSPTPVRRGANNQTNTDRPPIDLSNPLPPTAAPDLLLASSSSDSDTQSPSWSPTKSPTELPTRLPSSAPITTTPSKAPTRLPSRAPATNSPVLPPATTTTTTTTATTTTTTRQPRITYQPGNLTEVNEIGLRLSIGLSARVIAQAGQPVVFGTNGDATNAPQQSSRVFHPLPDGAATFPDPRQDENPGGWIYVSNSEVRHPDPKNHGGVGAITFDRRGQLKDYRMVLPNSTGNCGGGKTPWNSWVSCEEWNHGRIWQVDPTGERPARQTTLGSEGEGGLYEAFSYDLRNPNVPRFFVTEDDRDGPLRRFTPEGTLQDYEDDPWEILHAPGVIDYLVLQPDVPGDTKSFEGTFFWTRNEAESRASALLYYSNAEGMDIFDNELYFISKRLNSMIILDMDTSRYTRHSTRSGLFKGTPDNIHHILGEDSDDDADRLLYFTEEDDSQAAGIHARNRQGDFFCIVESPHSESTAGFSFSPDFASMYFAWQHNGTLFEVKRTDGLSFRASTLDIHYHTRAS